MRALRFIEACIALLLVFGCGDDDPVPMRIDAATSPDTVAAGAPVEIKIHWHDVLGRVEPARFDAVDDSTFELRLFVHPKPFGVGAPEEPWQRVFILPTAPPRSFHVRVVGVNTINLPIAVGEVAVRDLAIFRIRAERNGGEAVPGATGTLGLWISDSISIYDEPDSIIAIVTDENGLAEITGDCDVLARRYGVSMAGIWLLANDSPCRCGVTERIVVRFR